VFYDFYFGLPLKAGIFFFQLFVLKQKAEPKIQADQKCRAEKQKESEQVEASLGYAKD
jgi:hypothetical protein